MGRCFGGWGRLRQINDKKERASLGRTGNEPENDSQVPFRQLSRLVPCAGGSFIFVIIGAVSFFSSIFSLGRRNDSFYGYVAPQTVQQSGKEQTNSSSQPKTNYSGQSSGAIEPVVGEYFTDRLGWIKQSATLNAGMETFFKKTSVKPYLYLTDNVYGSTEPSDKQMDTFANSLYDKLFTDENHFLLVFQEYGDYYMTWYVSGSDAAEVVDEEAANIVLDYVDEYYSSDMGEEEYFSNVFSMAAGDIMEGGQ